MLEPNKPDVDDVIVRVNDWGCWHSKFKVDTELDYVECGLCGKHLNPMWVLGQLCSQESLAKQRLNALKRISEKAEKKNRCKCQHCGKMTRIQK